MSNNSQQGGTIISNIQARVQISLIISEVELVCVLGGGRQGIKPHYLSEGRRQVSGGVFWGCMALSAHYRDSCQHGCLYLHINKRIFMSL